MIINTLIILTNTDDIYFGCITKNVIPKEAWFMVPTPLSR